MNEDIYYEIKYIVNDSQLDIETKLSRVKDVIKGFKQPKKERELFKCFVARGSGSQLKSLFLLVLNVNQENGINQKRRVIKNVKCR